MSWTDERIERLKSLWTKGMTASFIAEELGGVSRNAVIGKAHRLGLQSRPSPVKPNEPAPKAKAKVREKAEAAAPAPRPAAAAAPAAPWEDDGEETPAAAAKAPREPAEKPGPTTPQPIVRSIGPGGFIRQGPSDQ